MKILNNNVGRMYVTTIILLLVITVISSYILSYIPYNLILSVMICSLAELLIKKYYIKQKNTQIPFSGIITGFIIGLVAPLNGFIISIIVASVFAVFSKIFIKFKSSNIFNPAAFGLLIGLGILYIGDQWWGSVSYNINGLAIPIAIIFIISAYESKRIPTALSFTLVFIVISFIFSNIISFSGFLNAVTGVNYLFAFLMITEPKTSPYKKYAQIFFGSFIAILSYFIGYIGILYPYIIALLIANAVYAFYRRNGNKIIPTQKEHQHTKRIDTNSI